MKSNRISRLGWLRHLVRVTMILAIFVIQTNTEAEILARWDFTTSDHGWTGNTRVTDWRVTTEGLAFRSAGEDPWIESPSIDVPPGARIKFSFRMRCQSDGAAQIFYGTVFREEQSLRFRARDNGKWNDYTLVLGSSGKGTRFRFDPSSGEGDFVIAWIQIETLARIESPALNPPRRPASLSKNALTLHSGEVSIVHANRRWGGFIVRHGDRELAASHDTGQVAIILDNKVHWLETSEATFEIERPHADTLIERASIKRGDAGTFSFTRSFKSLSKGGFAVEASVICNRSARLLHFSWLTLFPGLETYGERKHQGLMSGVEYLSDEPSSSEADVRGPNSDRRVPDPVKLTFPLMAIEHEGHYIALQWNSSPWAAALFDSPDRVYRSKAHLMALHAPNVGDLRLENELYAHTPIQLKANEPLVFRFSILAGRGSSAVDAVRHALRNFEFPPIAEFTGGFQSAVDLLAHGWVDSKLNEDGLIRHAVWQGFGAKPAADAAAFMNWLASKTQDDALRKRLHETEEQTLGHLSRGDPFDSGVSHVRPPIAPLLYGRIPDFVASRLSQAQATLRNFDDRGVLAFVPKRTGPDYGETHFANHANGLAFNQAANILDAAALSGDTALLFGATELLDKLTQLYRHTVPRGAQTWEVPLHTPDILASANMVKAYALAYRLTGRTEYLDEARYWAWTGIPFVYLSPPVPGGIGNYATTPVLGATAWVAPYWIGLPVQWCGLVYASALHDLAPFDHSAPWAHIARGITATGLQMSWPREDVNRQGLLPDFFQLRDQHRDGPAINPGTVQAHLPELYKEGKLYDFVRLRESGALVHAAGSIRVLLDDPKAARVEVKAIGGYLLLAGLNASLDRVVAMENGAEKPLKFEYDKTLRIATFPIGDNRIFEFKFSR